MFTRREISALLMAGLAQPALAQYGDKTMAPYDPEQMPPSQPPAIVASEPPKSVPQLPEGFAGSQETLAENLLLALTATQTGAGETVVVSPMSVAAALAVIAQGASAELVAAIGTALALDGSLKGALPLLLPALSAFGGEGPLRSALALVLDHQLAARDEPLAKLKALGVEISRDDLGKPEGLQKINDWVKARTAGLIDSILDEPPGAGNLVALNALAFKDGWDVAFEPERTAAATFTRVDGSTVETPMMRRKAAGAFGRSEIIVGAELGFQNENFALTLVSSADRPLAAADLLRHGRGWIGGRRLRATTGEVAIPRFKLDTRADLLTALDVLGLAPARNAPDSLAGFAEQPPRIGRVAQRCVLSLDEKGAQAAAATAVVTTRSLDTGQARFVADKPFLFALHERKTGFIVLAGYVATPSA